ncbi:hypothetical protein N7490_007428 [Penicillium lividum]|nr:hypothetical protein N7490_007428 [Penicillium lividum]
MEHSAKVWLYKLKQVLDQGKATPVGENAYRPSISSMNYFQDQSEIPSLKIQEYGGSRPTKFPIDSLTTAFDNIGRLGSVGAWNLQSTFTLVVAGRKYRCIFKPANSITDTGLGVDDVLPPLGWSDHPVGLNVREFRKNGGQKQ